MGAENNRSEEQLNPKSVEQIVDIAIGDFFESKAQEEKSDSKIFIADQKPKAKSLPSKHSIEAEQKCAGYITRLTRSYNETITTMNASAVCPNTDELAPLDRDNLEAANEDYGQYVGLSEEEDNELGLNNQKYGVSFYGDNTLEKIDSNPLLPLSATFHFHPCDFLEYDERQFPSQPRDEINSPLNVLDDDYGLRNNQDVEDFLNAFIEEGANISTGIEATTASVLAKKRNRLKGMDNTGDTMLSGNSTKSTPEVNGENLGDIVSQAVTNAIAAPYSLIRTDGYKESGSIEGGLVLSSTGQEGSFSRAAVAAVAELNDPKIENNEFGEGGDQSHTKLLKAHTESQKLTAPINTIPEMGIVTKEGVETIDNGMEGVTAEKVVAETISSPSNVIEMLEAFRPTEKERAANAKNSKNNRLKKAVEPIEPLTLEEKNSLNSYRRKLKLPRKFKKAKERKKEPNESDRKRNNKSQKSKYPNGNSLPAGDAGERIAGGNQCSEPFEKLNEGKSMEVSIDEQASQVASLPIDDYVLIISVSEFDEFRPTKEELNAKAKTSENSRLKRCGKPQEQIPLTDKEKESLNFYTRKVENLSEKFPEAKKQIIERFKADRKIESDNKCPVDFDLSALAKPQIKKKKSLNSKHKTKSPCKKRKRTQMQS